MNAFCGPAFTIPGLVYVPSQGPYPEISGEHGTRSQLFSNRLFHGTLNKQAHSPACDRLVDITFQSSSDFMDQRATQWHLDKRLRIALEFFRASKRTKLF